MPVIHLVSTLSNALVPFIFSLLNMASHGMAEIEGKAAFAQVENAAAFDVKGGVADYRAEAIAAEDVEHNMGQHATHREAEMTTA